jgi:hypothetical protein
VPLVTIQRDPRQVDDETAKAIRDIVHTIVVETLKVEPGEVEVRVRDIGHLDINYAPVGIEIDTGTGKDRWRVKQREALAKEVAAWIHRSRLLAGIWPGAEASYVWIRICESSFVPIGTPEKAR